MTLRSLSPKIIGISLAAIVVLVILAIVVFRQLGQVSHERQIDSAETAVYNANADDVNRQTSEVIGVINGPDNWKFVALRSTAANSYGEIFMVFTHNDEIAVGPGTDFDNATLTEAGVPDDLIKRYENGETPIPDADAEVPETIAADSSDPRVRYPIMNYFPAANSSELLFMIEPLFHDNSNLDSLYLRITAQESLRNLAIEQISSAGFDPADYEIEFVDFTNPFTGGKK